MYYLNQRIRKSTFMKKLNMEELIFINKYAQGLVDTEAVLQWFSQLKEADKYDVLRELWGLARQANVCEEDIILGASRCGLKNTLESQTTT